ncbi:MAG: type II toxin-antitoxin system RelE/ParE family toxin [Leptospiraceae bacterium]|nr:type II toxin-antitoxin system RelE/ParE family toxin [Leptospiraceae bacterium]MCP5498022.1 type II toxin-antitoxin system RelE/ParE family toxin [Leptospiraceae bacterium]
MAKRVVWSENAKNSRREILEYWFKRNGNKDYSKKLSEKFNKAIQMIKEFNYIGIATDYENVRAMIVEDYSLFYEIKSLL